MRRAQPPSFLPAPTFRPYEAADRPNCLRLFDANCPTYFAPNERAEYEAFLDAADAAYAVCVVDGDLLGAFGLLREQADRWSLRWIMLSPAVQGRGIGRAIMQQVVQRVVAAQGRVLAIAASHKSAPFFARFGAREVLRTAHGWGPDMHRVDMELLIGPGQPG